MEYYSRKTKNSVEKEKLINHLKEVSELAGIYADSFGEKEIGKLLGIFHDAGKASSLFQDVLAGKEFHVNHECAGAFFVKATTKSDMLAIIIYAHHKGLIWHISDDILGSRTGSRTTESREENRRFSVKGKEEYNIAYEYMKSVINEADLKKTCFIENYVSENYPNITDMLHIRMLLSCLCDADYTAASAFPDKSAIELSKEIPLESEKLLEALILYKNKINQSSSSDKNLNMIRNELFDICISAGEKEKGFYTLTAPTGTGKTLSLFAYALSHAKYKNKKRIVIVLPYLSIINQNARIYREICKEAGFDCLLESHSSASYNENTELYAEKWNAPIIITTSVKFFESLFKSKPTDLRFLHSIADSVIVFDEAQSIPTELIGTTMESINVLIEMFRCTVLFSTATQPCFEKRKDLKNIYDKACEIIPYPENYYRLLKRVNIDWRINNNMRISFDEIAKEMAEYKSAACVVNLKSHAHKLYDILSLYVSNNSLFFISTDMCKAHRDVVINEISYHQENNMPCLLVSTSCIEAGVDLDFDVMFRAVAPLDSIIQCAGRCNRNGKKNGSMIVFIPDEEKLYPSNFYENAAHIVLIINARHTIDINNPEHIKEYYDELFMANPKDKKKLVKAIEEHDFSETEKQYKFINNTGVNVLVPYKAKQELFDRLCREAIGNNCINKNWIRQAAEITVTSYQKDWLDANCIHPNIMTKYDGIQRAENWYILENTDIYTNKTGLTIKDDSAFETTF